MSIWFKNYFVILYFLTLPLFSSLVSFPVEAVAKRTSFRVKKIGSPRKRTTQTRGLDRRISGRRTRSALNRRALGMRTRSRRVARKNTPIVAAPLVAAPLVAAPLVQMEENILKQRIARNRNLNDYQDIGLTQLFSRGFYGQDVTVAVIEGGFYHTLAPRYRNNYTNVAILPAATDWYSEHREQILPPLAFYDPYLSPLNQRFERDLGRGKDFRFDHGDRVLSVVAEAAPRAKILPVMASFGPDDGSFIRALEALSERDDVKIINMSRWLQTAAQDETRLDPRVCTALRKCTDKGKVLVLSAGNTRSLIPSTPTRSTNDIRDISKLAANLISDLFHNLSANDSLQTHTVISGALNNTTDYISDYSIMAGEGPVHNNYIATKGENFTSVFGKVWHGTSASSPYTAGVLADLMSARNGVPGSRVVKSLFDGAAPRPFEPTIYGRGLVKADRALEELLAS